MSTAATPSAEQTVTQVVRPQQVVIYSHSPLVYWWPVWSVGFLFAFLTWMQGKPTQFGDVQVIVHPSKSLGVIYTFTFLLVMLMTHITVRGVASMVVIISAITVTLFLAYMDWWGYVLDALGNLAIYMNLGFYMFFSLAVLLIWIISFFIFDRLEYWVVHPGQMIHHSVFGDGEESFDTRGMTVNKLRSDLFRHWILGLGSGDLHIVASGATKGDFIIPNVLFIGTKVARIQELVATKPIQGNDNLVTVGQAE
jgi:hypothetical protein